MTTVSELVVSIRGDGIDTTQEELEDMDETVEDSADSMGDQASALEDLSSEFAGALQVAAVGLVAASTTLLSQVPVIGQLFDSLFAVVQAVAFQMDQVLRPVLSPLSKGFFMLAGFISGLEGPIGTVVGILGVLASAIAGAVGYAFTLGSGMATLSSIFGALTTAASVVIGALSAVAGAISLPAVAVGVLIAAIVGLIAALLFNFGGFRDKLISILSTIADKFVSGFKSFLKDPIGFMQNFIRSIIDLLLNTNWLSLGGKVGSAIIGGIKEKLGLGDGASGVLDFEMSSLMPDMDMPEFESSAGTEAFNEIESSQSFEEIKGGFKTPEDIEALQSEDGTSRFPRPRDKTTKLFIDGREAGRGTQKERFDESARRGQTF